MSLLNSKDEIFAEGIKGFVLGYPFSKLIFHSTTQSDDNSVENNTVVTITMPTVGLMQVMSALNKGFAENKEKLVLAAKQTASQLEAGVEINLTA